LSVLVQIRC